MQKSIKLLKYLTYIAIFIIPFIALVVSSTMFFPFITGKNFLFRIIVEIAIALWATVALFEPRYRSKKTWIFVTLAIFTFGMALSSVFGANFYRSFWSNYERMEGLVTFLHLFAYFIVLIGLLKTEKVWNWFLKFNLGVNALVGLYGLMQLTGKFTTHQGDRLDASLGNASYMAIYMAFGLFTALMFFFRNKTGYRWVYAPIIALQAVILYYTATRGAILGAIGGLFLAAVLVALFAGAGKKVKLAAWGFVLAICVAIGGFLAIKNTSFVSESPVLRRFSDISLKERTTESRLTIWKMSWSGFVENPLLGWGPENFNLVFNKYYKPSLYNQEPWFDRAHNVFFDRLTSGGIVGLVSYLGLFFFAVYYLWSRREKTAFSVYDSAVLTAMFAAYFVHNLFVFDNLISLILFFTFLAYIHYRRVEGRNDIAVDVASNKTLSVNDTYKKMYAVAGIAGLAIFSLYYLNVPGILASKNIIYALKESSSGNAEGAFRKFQKAISYNSFGSLEAREHMTSFVMNAKDAPSISPEVRNEMIAYTIDELKKQNEEYPGDIRELIFLGMFYNKVGIYDEAEKILKEAIALSPAKQQIYFELGSMYIGRQDYANGLQTLKTAFELDETFGEARIIYAVAAIFAGNDKLAEELMAEHGGTIAADERFLRAYASKNNYVKVISILKLFIDQDPNNIQNRLRLAATYLQSGQRQAAIAEIEKSIEINPSFKDQGEYYINEIRAGRNP